MAITASEARRTLFPLIERVNNDREAVEIVSRKGSAVLMPADEYAAWKETAYLFRSPRNAQRLLAAFAEARSKKSLTETARREGHLLRHDESGHTLHISLWEEEVE